MNNFFDETNCAVTISDINGIIIYMNKKSAEVFKEDGGYNLIGKSLFNCHNNQSIDIIKQLTAENKSNTYTIEKNGKKKLIHQMPWCDNGEVKGLIELSIEIPFNMDHHFRD
jgi:transcriptional regulator with PAS, ATPase and Fis domain